MNVNVTCMFTIKGLPSITLHFSLTGTHGRSIFHKGKHLVCRMSLLLTKWSSVWGGRSKYKDNCSFHSWRVFSVTHVEGPHDCWKYLPPGEVLSNMNKKLRGKRDNFSIFETPKKLKPNWIWVIWEPNLYKKPWNKLRLQSQGSGSHSLEGKK